MSVSTSTQARLPITIITGFAGSGKTTLILNLLPQLRIRTPDYKLALIKNEIGDLAVDSALAASAELAGSQELLGDCICCTNVGQIGDALATLDSSCRPDRIIIETSGSAEPLKLVLEINRLAKETGRYEVDGVISVVDAENWGGYANKSYTARLQAQQTDVIVVNKWEGLSERELDLFFDRLGELDVETPQIKSQQGKVSVELVFGVDGKMRRVLADGVHGGHGNGHHHDHAHGHAHGGEHMGEMECLSVTLTSDDAGAVVDLEKLGQLLKTAPKDEVYRIKSILYSPAPPRMPDGTEFSGAKAGRSRYILNWSFGRWTWYRDDHDDEQTAVLRMSIFTAQYESNKWLKRIESGKYIALADAAEGKLEVKRVQ